MKICIIWGWYDYLPIIPVLNQYKHTYMFVHDTALWPLTEKSEQYITERLTQIMNHMLKKYAIDSFLLPPFLEYCAPRSQKNICSYYQDFFHQALRKARIGKVWVMTTHPNKMVIQSFIETLLQDYTLTPQQQRTKKFHTPCNLWIKECRFIPVFVPLMAKSDWMVRKKIKNYLSFFKDADVDLLVPYSWEILYYEKVITHMLSSRMCFAGLELFRWVLESRLKENQDNHYHTTVLWFDRPRWLSEKKRQLPLSKWWACEITFLKDQFFQ